MYVSVNHVLLENFNVILSVPISCQKYHFFYFVFGGHNHSWKLSWSLPVSRPSPALPTPESQYKKCDVNEVSVLWNINLLPMTPTNVNVCMLCRNLNCQHLILVTEQRIQTFTYVVSWCSQRNKIHQSSIQMQHSTDAVLYPMSGHLTF